jgi:hypothetical protein
MKSTTILFFYLRIFYALMLYHHQITFSSSAIVLPDLLQLFLKHLLNYAGSSATLGSSATGSSATGSSATGSSATGSSATGSSATGSSATGSSATPLLAIGSSAKFRYSVLL